MTTPSAGCGQGLRESLRQHEGRAQVGFDMAVPALAGGIVPFVALEDAGVVHQHADRPERRFGRGKEAGDRGLVGEIGGQHHGFGAEGANAARRPLGVVPAGMAVDRHREPGFRQRQRNRAAEASRAAGHQGGAWDGGRDREHRGGCMPVGRERQAA